MVKIFNITYAKAELKKVADNATQMNAEERTLLLSLLDYLEDLFDGTLVEWATDPVDLDLEQFS